MAIVTDLSLDTPIVGWIVMVALFWELIWKGLALWRCGRKNQPVWFIFILILNTVGILPIIYLILSKNKKSKKTNR